ncbi:LexA family protein [Cellvibrio sp. QJXJ]|uniref:LexA family protein n=1 Tax=Cellvibrio sp. QJXJ TaxID=2964606 RepID=UPI0021C41029|nr:translesion error-prone DNA polymerase V autoproteolytic subunit [Cellvibrio sp. QJXJ]UUA75247.1 translesion error-prone DNA polymerase V autoproteolytic subunit [Cellvibrio sp. QJXJ]
MKILPSLPSLPLPLPLFGHRVRAGFPSPAESFIEKRLDLNEHLIAHPSATYFCYAEGDSMRGYGIDSGDLLIVDRALEEINGDVIIAAVEGELTCKCLDKKHGRLVSGNPDYPPIPIDMIDSAICEGVVIASIRYHRKPWLGG